MNFEQHFRMRAILAVRGYLPLMLLVCVGAEACAADLLDNAPRAGRPGVAVPGGYTRLAPANTARPLVMAIEDGLDCVELVVRRTKDGRHVAFDADRVDGKTSGSGAVGDQTLAELQALDAGSWFATRFAGAKILSSAEALALAKSKIQLLLVCQDVDSKQLVRELADAGMAGQVLVAGAPEVVTEIRNAADRQIGTCQEYAAAIAHHRPTATSTPDWAIISIQDCSPEVVARAHRTGLRVLANCDGPDDDPKSWDKATTAGVDMLRTRLPEEYLVYSISQRVKNRPVQIAAHRGASRYAPENTLASLEKASRMRADFVEIDVQTTSDGHFFLLHDGTLDRTTTGRGRVRQATAETLRGLDAGRWFGNPFAGAPVPELDAYLERFPPQMGLYFDAKDIAPEALAAAVEMHALVERTVVYQGPVYLEKLKQINPRIRLLAPVGAVSHVDTLAKRLAPYAVDTPWKLLSADYIEHCHSLGIKVFSDAKGDTTVEEYADAIRWGIDLVQTDHPLRFWRAVEQAASP
jgi:glycerophosphoryl diester phosphodiesterase